MYVFLDLDINSSSDTLYIIQHPPHYSDLHKYKRAIKLKLTMIELLPQQQISIRLFRDRSPTGPDGSNDGLEKQTDFQN